MDQGPRSRLSPLVLAARLRCVFSEPEPSQLDALLEYVKTQEEHHRSPTFQEEYHEFLHKHGVEYDERLCVGLKQPSLSRAFSARSKAFNIPGALPQAGNEPAPLALTRYNLAKLRIKPTRFSEET